MPTTPTTWPMNSATTANLHLRSSGSTSGNVVTTVPKGTNLSITGAPVNGWYPVNYNGQALWASADYFGPLTAPTTTPTPTPTPTPAPGQPGTPLNQSNPWYDPTDLYGATSNGVNTPVVKQAENFDQAYERWITDLGYGGANQKGNFARNLADRARAGLAAAQTTNPSLIPRDYLSNALGTKFLDNARAAATPLQRGENWMSMSPRARWTPR